MKYIACVDDSKFQLDILKEQLEAFFDANNIQTHVDTFLSANDLLDECGEGSKYSIYILDLIMPKMNGMELAHIIREKDEKAIIIFLTASKEYLLESYDVSTFYYLLKPVDNKKLQFVMQKAVNIVDKENLNLIEVKTKNGLTKISLSDIVYVDMINRSLNYHLSNNTTLVTPMLRIPFNAAIEEMVRYDCFKTSGNTTLVNLNHVKMVDVDTVVLDNGECIYPSRNYYKDFYASWKEFFHK